MLPHNLRAIPKPTLPLRGRTSFRFLSHRDQQAYPTGVPLPVRWGRVLDRLRQVVDGLGKSSAIFMPQMFKESEGHGCLAACKVECGLMFVSSVSTNHLGALFNTSAIKRPWKPSQKKQNHEYTHTYHI